MHFVVVRGRKADEIPQAIGVFGIVLRRPDVVHDFGRLGTAIPAGFLAHVAVAF